MGLEVWALALAVPSFEHGLGAPAAGLGSLLLPVLVLAAGEALRRRRARLGRALLLAGFPAAVALGAALRADLALADAWAGVLGPLVAVSMLLYLAVVLHSFARPAPTRATGWQPVPETSWTQTAPTRALSTGVVLATLAAGLFAIGALPFLPSRATLEGRFALGPDDARTLAIALGGGLFAIALGAIIGPGLRARRVGDEARERIGPGVAASLALAVVAALAYAWLARAS